MDHDTFTYDTLGNRLTHNDRSGTDVVYSHNNANEYTTIGGTGVSHDAAGNLSADQDGYEYAYDHDNRLTTITKNSGGTDVATYTYDALGRRVEFIDEVGTVTTRYYYDGWRVLTETNGSDTVQRDYIYGNYIDEVLVMVDVVANPDEDYYYAHDHLFGPVALMSDDGTVVERYEYDAYGAVTIWDSTFANTRSTSNYDSVIGFTGQREDVLDGYSKRLYHYRSRYYDTASGRFLQRDLYGIQNELSLFVFDIAGRVIVRPNFDPTNQYRFDQNTYLYAFGNTLIYVDPYGDNPAIPVAIGIGAVEAAAAAFGLSVTACLANSACRHAAAEVARELASGAAAAANSAINTFTVPLANFIVRPNQGVRCRVPRSCSNAIYGILRRGLISQCKDETKDTCNEEGLSLQELFNRAARQVACHNARKALQDTCFNPKLNPNITEQMVKGHNHQARERLKGAKNCLKKIGNRLRHYINKLQGMTRTND